METFAELGIVGLALLGAALITRRRRGSEPPITIRRGRVRTYVSWMAASAFDWHWEMVGVTATALLVGSVGLVSAERRRPGRLPPSSRLALVGVTETLSVLAVRSLVGNPALLPHGPRSPARSGARLAITLVERRRFSVVYTSRTSRLAPAQPA